jgi:hypothetical protein
MQEIQRFSDWRIRLHGYMASTHAVQFEAGKADCALDTAGAVEAMTGHDFARGFRGYRSIAAGLVKLRKVGFDDHVELARSMFPEIPVAMARVGDVAVLDLDDGLALCIVLGDRISVFSESGRGVVPLTAAVTAFRVGV